MAAAQGGVDTVVELHEEDVAVLYASPIRRNFVPADGCSFRLFSIFSNRSENIALYSPVSFIVCRIMYYMYIGCEVTKYPGRDKANNEDFSHFFQGKI